MGSIDTCTVGNERSFIRYLFSRVTFKEKQFLKIYIEITIYNTCSALVLGVMKWKVVSWKTLITQWIGRDIPVA